uniref:Protein wntless n=1 Tax=Aceria tosichella TaxID=561515 RepID=A0A6G1SP65_9ACAR
MGATVLESLSNTKLGAIITILFGIQLVSFYIGAFLTPSPSSFEQFTSVHCYRHDRNSMAIPRHHKKHDMDVGKNCNRSTDSENDISKTKYFETRTFAVQLPLPRDGMDLAYSRWMQTLLVLLIPEFQYDPLLANNMYSSGANSQGGQHKHHLSNDGTRLIIDHFSLLIDIDLAVKNKEDKEWTVYAQRRGLKRTLKFHPHDLRQSHNLDCEPIQLFELQSLHYDYYLINFELREDKSSGPGRLTEVTGVAIHHNGGFTQIWLVLKSVFFVLTSATLVWYCRRLMSLNRKTILIERILIGLGAALTQLNFPAELLSIHFEIPFMMFLNDLRQGIFYCVLLSFWIIFVGEHLLDGTRKNSQLACYTKELLAICVASLALLIFDLSERGIQAFDPFLTIWESEPNLASLSIMIASCACLAYLGFLLYYIYLAFNTISGKQCALPKMQITKRLKYQGMIYRFKFLLCATAICAISTLVFYGLSHRNDWNYDDDSTYNLPTIEWTSAMLTTVCAMWNSYVIVLMIMYAPSYKGISGEVGMPEQIEFDCLTDDRDDELLSMDGDMNLLQELANKSSLD